MSAYPAEEEDVLAEDSGTVQKPTKLVTALKLLSVGAGVGVLRVLPQTAILFRVVLRES